MKFDIEMIGGQKLNDVYLFTNKKLEGYVIGSEKSFYKSLSECKQLYFCGKYTQGGISIGAIKGYEFITEVETRDVKIYDYVKDNISIFEDKTSKIATFIQDNKNQLLEILKSDILD